MLLVLLNSLFLLYSPQNIGWSQEARVAHITGKGNSLFLEKIKKVRYPFAIS